MTAWLLGTSLGRNILSIGAALVAALAIIGGLMRAGAAKERNRAARRSYEAERAANERITNAPTLRNASDADRIDFLLKYAKRNGN
jgi:hypothetical protein